MTGRNEFEKYIKILKEEPLLYEAVMSLDIKNSFDKTNCGGNSADTSEQASKGEELARYVLAPVLVLYTRWIIGESQKRGIDRLYFLARDGWLMYHIALRICASEKLDMACSYFYCSRYSLRAGAYRFFDDSAYDRLFLHSYRQSPYDMLCRAGLTDDERKLVYDDISKAGSEQKAEGVWRMGSGTENKRMGRKEFGSFCEEVRGSAVFRKILSEKSEEAYIGVMKYIGQEGMNRHRKIGIVDLGWTGSLQYTLRRLLDSSFINTHITGFYMGLLEKPPEASGSIYVPWLFDEKDIKTKSWFAHNLMECLCSAPHGMTVGYKREGNRIVPELAEQENDPEYLHVIKTKALEMADKMTSCSYNGSGKKYVLKLLYSLMCSPADADIKILKKYAFCDDVGGQYHKPIVQTGKANNFCREILPFKLFHRDETDGFYWYCGSLKASRIHFKRLYRAGYRLTRSFIERRKLSRSHSPLKPSF